MNYVWHPMSVVNDDVVLLEHLRQKLIPVLQLGQLLGKLLPLLSCEFDGFIFGLHKELVGLYQLIDFVCCLGHPLCFFAIGVLRVLLVSDLSQLSHSLLKLHHTFMRSPACSLSIVKLLF